MSEFKYEGRVKQMVTLPASYIGHKLFGNDNKPVATDKDGKILHTFDEATLQRLDRLTEALNRIADLMNK